MDKKKHRLLFPEGNGLINGWTMLEKALQVLGHEEDRGDRGKEGKTYSSGKEDKQKERAVLDIPMKLMSLGRRRQKTIWVDKFEYSPKGDMGLLKYVVVGSWKVLPAAAQTLTEVVDWAKRVWRLKGCIAIYPLNQTLFFMGF